MKYLSKVLDEENFLLELLLVEFHLGMFPNQKFLLYHEEVEVQNLKFYLKFYNLSN